MNKEQLVSKVNSLHDSYLKSSILLYEYISSVRDCLKTYAIESGEPDDDCKIYDYCEIDFLKDTISCDIYVFIDYMWFKTDPVPDAEDAFFTVYRMRRMTYHNLFIHDLIEKRFSELLMIIHTITTESEFIERINKILTQVLGIKLNDKREQVLMFYQELLNEDDSSYQKLSALEIFKETFHYFPQVKKTLKDFLSCA